jgi:dCMP deaminase
MSLDLVRIAKAIAASSKDPKYKVSAIIYDDDGNIRSTGYNGAPRGVVDYSFRYRKPLKQYYVAHAEENAIAQAARNGVRTLDCHILIWGKAPCASCARMIIQAGLVSVMCQNYSDLSSYADSHKASMQMFEEARVEVKLLPAEDDGDYTLPDDLAESGQRQDIG